MGPMGVHSTSLGCWVGVELASTFALGADRLRVGVGVFSSQSALISVERLLRLETPLRLHDSTTTGWLQMRCWATR